MKIARITGGSGVVCLLFAAAVLLTGITRGAIWGGLVALALAFVLLLVTLVLVLKEASGTPAVSGERPQVPRWLIPAAAVSGGLGLAAASVAIVVAEGEAQGHAVRHLVSGLLCLSLFAALGFWWRPPTASTSSILRGLLLLLLWLAAVGAFMESLGGSGYDAANSGSRIAFLVSLHGVALPFGALFILAAPLGVVTLVAVIASRAVRRLRTM